MYSLGKYLFGEKMKHKHAEIIKAWADGAEIEMAIRTKDGGCTWLEVNHLGWEEDCLFRIKPEPKPDIVKYLRATAIYDEICRWDIALPIYANLKIVFDVETGQPKSAEVLK